MLTAHGCRWLAVMHGRQAAAHARKIAMAISGLQGKQSNTILGTPPLAASITTYYLYMYPCNPCIHSLASVAAPPSASPLPRRVLK